MCLIGKTQLLCMQCRGIGPHLVASGKSHCKEYNQSDFGIDHLVKSRVESSLVLLEEGVCYDQFVLLAKLY